MEIDLKQFTIIDLWQLLVDINFCESKSAAKRAIEGNGIKIWDEEKQEWQQIELISNRTTIVRNFKSGIIRFGKRKFAKLNFDNGEKGLLIKATEITTA